MMLLLCVVGLVAVIAVSVQLGRAREREEMEKREDGFISIIVAVVLLLAIIGLFTVCSGDDANAAPPPTGPNGEHQVVVCKYVGTPGAGERLQTGNNPIVVSSAALTGRGFNGTFPFDFSDAQGRSSAVRWAANSQDGDLSDCPVPPPPPPPTGPTGPTTPPTGPTGPTTPPTGPTGPTEPPVTPEPPKDNPGRCEGNGQDRPKCQPDVVTAPPGLAFTGADGTYVLGVLALIIALAGGMAWVAGRKRSA